MLSILRMKDKVNLPKREGICSIYCDEKLGCCCWLVLLQTYPEMVYLILDHFILDNMLY